MMKRAIITVLICLLVFTLATAVSFSAKKPVTLSVCETQWGASSDPAQQEAVRKYMEEKTGINIKMIYIPMNAYSDKINVLLATGDIPDVYRVTKAMVNVQAWTQKGYTMDIQKYVAKNPLFQIADKKYFDYMKVKGRIHAIPRQKEQEKVIWLRQDILDKYGVKLSSTPTTEEFYNEMKKVKDVIPFSFPKFLDNLPFFYNSFGCVDEFVLDKRGYYYDAFNTKEMKECLKYVSKLYKEGIIDQEFPTVDNTVLRNNLISGKAASNLDYDIRYFYYMTEITRLDPNAKPNLKPIFKLVGPKGYGGTLSEAIQDAYAVSPKCKDPQAAVDLLAWMFFTADGIKSTRFGLPGVHYTVKNGVAELTPQSIAGGMTFDLTQILKYYIDVPDMKFGFKFPDEDLNDKYLALTKDISKNSGKKYVVPAGLSPTYDKVGPSLTKKRQEIALKIILGSVSVEDGFKEYNDFVKSINGDQILNELNK